MMWVFPHTEKKSIKMDQETPDESLKPNWRDLSKFKTLLQSFLVWNNRTSE